MKTDLGRGRAWIRHALNECSLESYFRLFQDDRDHKPAYYSRDALLWNQEATSLLVTMLSGLEILAFDIELDSPLLDPMSGGAVTFDNEAKVTADRDELGQHAPHKSQASNGAALAPVLPAVMATSKIPALTSVHSTTPQTGALADEPAKFVPLPGDLDDDDEDDLLVRRARSKKHHHGDKKIKKKIKRTKKERGTDSPGVDAIDTPEHREAVTRVAVSDMPSLLDTPALAIQTFHSDPTPRVTQASPTEAPTRIVLPPEPIPVSISSEDGSAVPLAFKPSPILRGSSPRTPSPPFSSQLPSLAAVLSEAAIEAAPSSMFSPPPLVIYSKANETSMPTAGTPASLPSPPPDASGIGTNSEQYNTGLPYFSLVLWPSAFGLVYLSCPPHPSYALFWPLFFSPPPSC